MEREPPRRPARLVWRRILEGAPAREVVYAVRVLVFRKAVALEDELLAALARAEAAGDVDPRDVDLTRRLVEQREPRPTRGA